VAGEPGSQNYAFRNAGYGWDPITGDFEGSGVITASVFIFCLGDRCFAVEPRQHVSSRRGRGRVMERPQLSS
jgi:hypothetical protein